MLSLEPHAQHTDGSTLLPVVADVCLPRFIVTAGVPALRHRPLLLRRRVRAEPMCRRRGVLFGGHSVHPRPVPAYCGLLARRPLSLGLFHEVKKRPPYCCL